MASENKMRKVDKYHHWGRGGRFLKAKYKCKGLNFYNASQRKVDNKIEE